MDHECFSKHSPPNNYNYNVHRYSHKLCPSSSILYCTGTLEPPATSGPPRHPFAVLPLASCQANSLLPAETEAKKKEQLP